MIPKPHQLKFADKCWNILKEVGYVYLQGKPRAGKTLTSILTVEKSKVVNNVLVITTKNAIGYPKKKDEQGNIVRGPDNKEILVTNPKSKLYIKEDEEGWLKTLKLYPTAKNYTVTNFDQARKLKSEDYDLVIIDESHNLGVLGKPTNRYRVIRKLCYDMPHIHLSGTAIVESPNGIYHQMAISKYNPFPYKNFYEFFFQYGKPYYIKAAGREINQYDKAKEDILLPIIDEFTVYMTQEDAGISKDVQAEDVLHYVELCKETKYLYSELQEHNIHWVAPYMMNVGFVYTPNSVKYDLVCDSVMKLRTSLHMLESGVVKVGDNYIELGNLEKVNYVKEKFGDTKDVGIMCHFIGERNLLSKHFKFASIYSSTAHAEGVDLSHLKHFVIFSSGYSGSKFIQRRDRVVNVNGSNTTKVHHILVKGAISEQVYKTVSKKEDFNNSTYEKTSIN